MADADDSFKNRVEKIFGSLSSSSSPSLSSSRSPWSLSDVEVERREWKRHQRADFDVDDQTPSSSSFDDGFFNVVRKTARRNRRDLQDLSEDEDEDEEDGGDEEEGGRDGIDTWDVRGSIGLDCTLDNEDEEDAYDKMAEGRESEGDYLYMKDVTDYGPYLNSYNVLPSSVHEAPRDSRANHHAAKMRLKEDELLAKRDGSDQKPHEPITLNGQQDHIASEDEVKVRPILKRKNEEAAFKSLKRVRFDTMCKDNYKEESEQVKDTMAGPSLTRTESGGDDRIFPKNERRVPDYILNPSKYTCYSFDSLDDGDEESNSKACMDFLEHIKLSKQSVVEQHLEESSTDIQNSVVFMPRKKENVDKPINGSDEGKLKQSFPATSSAVKVCVVQEEEADADTAEVDTKSSSNKPGRHYRSKLLVDDEVS